MANLFSRFPFSDSSKNDGLQKKKLFIEQTFCRLCNKYWITYYKHMTSHAIEIDKIADVMISL